MVTMINMERPLLYDLFCGAGGASMGYHRAGFEIIGIDNKPQKNYPFEFIQMDALEFLQAVIEGKYSHPDAIHASPPCQAYSIMRNLPWNRHRQYPELIEPTRTKLEFIDVPWVIENVMGAHLPAGWLCGQSFGLPIFFHRAFETNWLCLFPPHNRHDSVIQSGRLLGSRARVPVLVGQSSKSKVELVAKAKDIDWMTGYELTQAIPPAYTEFMGNQLIRLIASIVTTRGLPSAYNKSTSHPDSRATPKSI